MRSSVSIPQAVGTVATDLSKLSPLLELESFQYRKR